MTYFYDYNSTDNTVDKWELRHNFGDARADRLFVSKSLFCHIFRDKDLKLFSDVSVPKNSKLYFAQPVPIAMNEVRRNYTIVKKPESADYIIFAPQKNPKCTFGTFRSECYKESKYLYVGSNEYGLGTAKWLYPEPETKCTSNGTVVMYIIPDARNAYRNLLSGNFKKPCVTCDKLDLSTTDKVTLDALTIVLTSAKSTERYWTDTQLADLQTKLTMLGQYDWRSVPYTIRVLRDLLYNTGAGYRLINTPSINNKTVNAVLTEKLNFDKTDAYDLILGRQLLASVLNADLTTPAFVALDSLFTKLLSNGLSYAHLLYFFDCTVRLTDKTTN